MKSRRAFIKNVAKTGLLIGLLPLKKMFSANVKTNNLPTWYDLIETARWCPTVHNLQPHKIKITSNTEADLYYDPKRLLPFGDPNAIFCTVAMGIFIENLSIVAFKSGHKVVVEQLFEPISISKTEPTLFAKLKIVQTSASKNINPDLILQRKTARIDYNSEPIHQSFLNDLKAEATRFNQQLNSTENPEMVKLLTKLNQETLFEDLENQDLRTELDQLFRYSEQDATFKKDGLWSKCMGFSGSLMKSVFQNHKKWNHGFRKTMLQLTYKSSLKNTNTICWLTGNFDQTTDWINAGTTLARIWLLATEQNVYIQPFGSLITNQNAFNKINSFLNVDTLNEKKMWLIFRMGYANEPARSFRLDAKDLIIEN